ncbi:hypothetical protein U0070_026768, partial [Myodes glareolus]
MRGSTRSRAALRETDAQTPRRSCSLLASPPLQPAEEVEQPNRRPQDPPWPRRSSPSYVPRALSHSTLQPGLLPPASGIDSPAAWCLLLFSFLLSTLAWKKRKVYKMPIAQLLELWKKIEVEPMEIETTEEDLNLDVEPTPEDATEE